MKERELISKAIELQKKGFEQDAIDILKPLHQNHPENRKVNSLLGMIYTNLGLYDLSKPHLEKAINLKTKSEMVFLSLYITYANLEDYEGAFKILFDYLDENPAELFKDTLSELLDGLLDGFGISEQDKILFYSRKNDVLIPNGLGNGTD